MRIFALTGIVLTVALTALMASSASARSLCSEAFTPARGTLATLETLHARAQRAVEALTLELKKPVTFWRDQETRSFRKFRSIENNPARLKVEARLREAQARAHRLARQLKIAKDLGLTKMTWTIAWTNSRHSFPGHSVQLQTWMDARLSALDAALSSEMASEEHLQALENEHKQLQADVSALGWSHKSEVVTALLRRLTEAQESKMRTEMAEHAKRILGRVPDQPILDQLAAIAEELSLTPSDALWAFRRVSGSGEREHNLIADRYTVLLTRTALWSRVQPEVVALRFLEIQRLGSSKKPDFHIPDLEVAVLTDISFEVGASAQDVAQRFFELEKLGRGYSGKLSFEFINDPALVALTRLSFKEPHLKLGEMIQEYFRAFERGHTTVPGFYLNDLAVALLLTTRERQQTDLLNVDLNKKLFEIRNRYRRAIESQDAPDEAYSQLVDLGVEFNLETSQIIDLLRDAELITGAKVPIPAFKRALVAAFRISRAQTLIPPGPTPSFEILRAAILRPFRNTPYTIDLLVDSSTRARAAHDGSYATGLDLALGFHAYDHSAQRPGKDSGEATLFGVPLRHASMTMHIGGFSIDTYGDLLNDPKQDTNSGSR